jgi:hypothetical protein
MRDLSPAGWIILILFVLFILSININLLIALRKKQKPLSGLPSIRKAAGTLRQPWQAEDEGLAELSKRVSDLQQPPKSNSNPPQI